MTLSWFHLVLVYIIFNSASKLISKQALKNEEIDPTTFSGIWHLAVGILGIPYLLLESPYLPHNLEPWLVVILSGVLYTSSMLLYFHALKNIEVSQTETIANTRSIWLMLLGFGFFGEALRISKVLGVTLIFLGLAVIYRKKGESSFKKYHFFILIYAILISCAYALDKYALNYFSTGLYNILTYLIPGFLTFLVFPRKLCSVKSLLKNEKGNYLILVAATVQMISTLALYAAYKLGELSVVGPMAQTSTVFTIIVGITVLKERWNLKRKVIGVLITLVGVIFLRFFIF